jgi:uncharacterized protein
VPDGTIPEKRCVMWQDKRVIVAGGTAGFGLVLARHLARSGGRVVLVGRSSAGVRRAIEICERAGEGSVRGLAADLARPGEGHRVVAEAEAIFGGVDAVFCCVGRSGRGRVLDASADRLRESLEANLLAAVEITQAAADAVTASGGHLVYLGSLAGKLASPFMGSYAVGKRALAAYVDAVRLELAPRGVHVLLVSPGPIGRRDDDPAAGQAAERYADDVAKAGLPAEALAAGGTRRLRPLDPDRLAGMVLEACRRRTSELVVPRKAAWLAGLIEWFPDAGRRLLARVTRGG